MNVPKALIRELRSWKDCEDIPARLGDALATLPDPGEDS